MAAVATDWATLFGPVASGVTDAITALLPVVIPVFVLLAGISIAPKILAKFGVRK